MLLVFAALALSCGREKGAAGGQAAGQPRRDHARYVRETAEGETRTSLAADLSAFDSPGDPAEFTRLFHLPPVRQDKTGTCWSFAATSLLESELRRRGRAEVKLSEMHTVYWEYVEKARRFIREKGNSFLGEGSEPNSALARIKQYGVVRAADYPGLPGGATAHDHGPLFREFREYLSGLAARNAWDEASGLRGVRAVLDRRLGRPPGRISVDGRSLTPLEYLEALALDPDDYVAFISFMDLPFYAKGEFRVPDNWWHCADFHNVPLYEFSLALLRALRRGYTAALAVDFTEPGYSGENDVAMVPSFDIPKSYIDQSSREFRFANRSTTDDHAVHCVGYLEAGKGVWFLVKDSWETAYRGKAKGYFFYENDYIRLKGLMFMVHRDAVGDVLKRFKAAE
jgi:bleomycin hydrolase